MARNDSGCSSVSVLNMAYVLSQEGFLRTVRPMKAVATTPTATNSMRSDRGLSRAVQRTSPAIIKASPTEGK